MPIEVTVDPDDISEDPNSTTSISSAETATSDGLREERSILIPL